MPAVVALLQPGVSKTTPHGVLGHLPALPLLTFIQAKVFKLLGEGFKMRRRIMVEVDDLDPPTKEEILLPMGKFCLAGQIFPASVLDDLMELGLVDKNEIVTDFGEELLAFLQKPLAEGFLERLRVTDDSEEDEQVDPYAAF